MFALAVMALPGLAVLGAAAIAGRYLSIAAEIRAARWRSSGLVPPGRST